MSFVRREMVEEWGIAWTWNGIMSCKRNSYINVTLRMTLIWIQERHYQQRINASKQPINCLSPVS